MATLLHHLLSIVASILGQTEMALVIFLLLQLCCDWGDKLLFPNAPDILSKQSLITLHILTPKNSYQDGIVDL